MVLPVLGEVGEGVGAEEIGLGHVLERAVRLERYRSVGRVAKYWPRN
jgi:hypothetical protein